jgi:hypothetical protein
MTRKVIKVDWSLTPSNAKERGYLWYRDGIYDSEAPPEVNKDLEELISEGWKLGEPALTELKENCGVGLYKPLE